MQKGVICAIPKTRITPLIFLAFPVFMKKCDKCMEKNTVGKAIKNLVRVFSSDLYAIEKPGNLDFSKLPGFSGAT